MRVLFYGGCHALALETLFRASAAGSHRFSSLQNFELINSGTPFPYERLTSCDAVVYSPVRNKDQWNTSHLQERCDALGIPTVRFPWLQWNGYFPDVTHLDRAPHIWGYQRLIDLAGQGAGFPELLAEARQGFDPVGYARYAFDRLEENESDVDIPISGFIRRAYREQRLFLTPNHPALPLYLYVQKQVAHRLGIQLKWFVRHEELHPDAFLILPTAAHALGLRFAGDEYRPAEWKQGIGLEPFLSLTLEMFGKAPVSLAAASPS
jgi:hypothetical protein